MTEPRLQTRNLRKVYPGTVALDDVSVSFAGGMVHALLGKNGAGKSTLVKIFGGGVAPTSGTVLVDGVEVSFQSPLDAFRCGIATVHQELSLVPDLSVAENIFLGRMPRRRTIGVNRIAWAKTFEKAQAILDEFEAKIDARAKVSELGVASQQVVEIAKAMSFNPSVLMLDEPTSALSAHEVKRLFSLVRQLSQKGVAILYITHRLQELKDIADTVTVLRDGKLIDSVRFDTTDPAGIVRMIFGPVEQKRRPRDLPHAPDVLLEVKHLRYDPRLKDVSFTLRAGEILGIAGTLGSGRTELLRVLFAADRADAGQVHLAGKLLRARDPAAARDAGIAFVPEHRKEQGLVVSQSTRSNLFLASLWQMARFGVSSRPRERRAAGGLVGRLDIKVADIDDRVESLSGGNQQKVVLGKWLNTCPKLMLFDEPTRGIDLLAKRQVFELMWRLSCEGVGSIFVSSELEELIEVCHRILILRNGRIVEAISPNTVTADDLLLKCMER